MQRPENGCIWKCRTGLGKEPHNAQKWKKVESGTHEDGDGRPKSTWGARKTMGRPGCRGLKRCVSERGRGRSRSAHPESCRARECLEAAWGAKSCPECDLVFPGQGNCKPVRGLLTDEQPGQAAGAPRVKSSGNDGEIIRGDGKDGRTDKERPFLKNDFCKNSFCKFRCPACKPCCAQQLRCPALKVPAAAFSAADR